MQTGRQIGHKQLQGQDGRPVAGSATSPMAAMAVQVPTCMERTKLPVPALSASGVPGQGFLLAVPGLCP